MAQGFCAALAGTFINSSRRRETLSLGPLQWSSQGGYDRVRGYSARDGLLKIRTVLAPFEERIRFGLPDGPAPATFVEKIIVDSADAMARCVSDR